MNAKAQQEIERDKFCRILGNAPRVRSARYSTTEEFAVFTETFGPPETINRKGETILFWNFIRRDGTEGFSLVSRPAKVRNASSQIDVHLVAKTGVRSFWMWTAVRLSAVVNSDEPPLFVNGTKRNFVVARVQ